MPKLTENIIMQRVRSSSTDFDKISQLNVTGRGLTDVSLLKRMKRLQVLSLSVNNISSLADIESCKHLKTLHLRQNKISDLDEIKYLMNLPVLESLSLLENPCTEDPNYRLTVIKNLRHLLELDGTPVTVEERKQAIKFGRTVAPNIDPLENLGNYIPDGPQIERSPTNSTHKLSDTAIILEEAKSPSEKDEELEVQKLPSSVKEIKQSTKPETCEKNETREGSTSVQGLEEIQSSSQSKEISNSKSLYCNVCKSVTDESSRILKMQHASSNVLSATLFLINELDYSSLQVVYSQVSAQLHALRFNCHLTPKYQNCFPKY